MATLALVLVLFALLIGAGNADYESPGGRTGTPHLHCVEAVVPVGNDFYTAPEELDVYTEKKCRAHPRGFGKKGGPFGRPNGPLSTETRTLGRFDSVCGHMPRGKGEGIPSFYSNKFPMASYQRGERVCMIWPSENRRSMTFTTEGGRAVYSDNANLPDGGLYVLRSEKDPSSDETLSGLLDHSVGGFSKPKEDRIVAFLGQSQFGEDDMKGYSNCPMFGQNDALAGAGASSDRLGVDACGQCFIIPYDLETGMYTFYWYWRADDPSVDGHGGGQPEEYITCFDVRIEEGRVDECPLAGDNGQYPGNLPGTGRHAGEYKTRGYMTGGPIVPSSASPCDAGSPPTPPQAPMPPPKADGPPTPPSSPDGVVVTMSPTPPRSPSPSPAPTTPEETPTTPEETPPTPEEAPPTPEETPPTPEETPPTPEETPETPTPAEPMCMQQSGAELAGDDLGSPQEVGSADACCAACEAASGDSPACNTYTYCPQDSDPADCTPGQCTLKNSLETRPAVVSLNVFTSGTNCLTNPEGCMDVTEDECKVDNQTSRPGAGTTFNDASVLLVTTPAQCCSLCQRRPGCKSWACDGLNGGCALKMSIPQQVEIPEDRPFFSGVVDESGVSDEILNVVLPADTPCDVEVGVDFPGNDLETLDSADEQECCRMCTNHFDGERPDCFAWTYNANSGECTLKSKIAERASNDLLVGATAF